MILLIWQYRQSGGVPIRISRSCTPARTSRSFTHARICRSCTNDRVSRSCTPVRISRPCTLARISCYCTHARISHALAHPPGYPTLAHTSGYRAFVPAYEPPLEHTHVFLDPHDPLNQHGLLSIIYYDTVNLTIPPPPPPYSMGYIIPFSNSPYRITYISVLPINIPYEHCNVLEVLWIIFNQNDDQPLGISVNS